MLKRIQVLEGGRVPAREARNWKIEGQKRRITRMDYRRLWNDFEMCGFMAQTGPWNLVRGRKCCKKEVHCQGKNETMSKCTRPCIEDDSLSSWLRMWQVRR